MTDRYNILRDVPDLLKSLLLFLSAITPLLYAL